MHESLLPTELARVRERHGRVYAIVSPPRCSSTAFARVFWEQPSVRFYYHEPFEVTYYMGQGLAEVVAKLESPLDLTTIKQVGAVPGARALVIKEMPYQVGDRFPLLVRLATRPIIFLMRDPRLNISSRRRKKIEVGDSPLYPFVESGWELLAEQIGYCREHAIDHLLVDSADFRGRPQAVFPEIFERFGLPWSSDCLRWQPCPQVELDNLAGKHRHLYGQVLASSGLQPDEAPIPPLDSFPEEDDLRDHVARCLKIYRELREGPERVAPADESAAAAG